MKKFLLFLFFSLGLTAAYAENHYYVIADAGSTGTRMHVFKHNKDRNLPTIEEIYLLKNNNPLASFSDSPSQAYDSIKPLLESTAKKIRDHHIKTPVSIAIMGTAGMRLLTNEQQAAIYRQLQVNIEKDYKNFFTPTYIQTISGKMEGVYGWLDINYLQKNFQNNRPTSGSIDVGGASTEIAFAMTKSSKPIDEVIITINNNPYIIYSKSFLGLGLDQARASMNVDEAAGHCYPNDYAISGQKGQFHIATCSQIYTQVIDNYNIAKLEMPTYKVTNFVAFSGAYHTFHFFASDPKIPDQDTLEQTIILPTCNNTWETLKAAYPAEPEAYLAAHCSDAVYLSNLFYNAFQLQHQQINILSSIQDNKINWTLGAMLYTIIQGEA